MSIADTGDLHKSHDHSDLGHTHDPFEAAPPAPVPPKETLAAAGEILRALAAPVRIAIVLQLHESERCVHELVDNVCMQHH